jgi:hypothetical protein
VLGASDTKAKFRYSDQSPKNAGVSSMMIFTGGWLHSYRAGPSREQPFLPTRSHSFFIPQFATEKSVHAITGVELETLEVSPPIEDQAPYLASVAVLVVVIALMSVGRASAAPSLHRCPVQQRRNSASISSQSIHHSRKVFDNAPLPDTSDTAATSPATCLHDRQGVSSGPSGVAAVSTGIFTRKATVT